MLSPFLYSLFTHYSVAAHDSNTIIKFADDTTVVGLVTDDDETAYRDLAVWTTTSHSASVWDDGVDVSHEQPLKAFHGYICERYGAIVI
jgi:hypothetical protein